MSTLFSSRVRLSDSPVALDAIGVEVEREDETTPSGDFVSVFSTLAMHISGHALAVDVSVNGYVQDGDRLRREIADALSLVEDFTDAVKAWRDETVKALLAVNGGLA